MEISDHLLLNYPEPMKDALENYGRFDIESVFSASTCHRGYYHEVHGIKHNLQLLADVPTKMDRVSRCGIGNRFRWLIH